MAFEQISASGYPMSINGGIPIGAPIRSEYSNLKHVEKNSFERQASGTNQFLGLIKLWNHYTYVHTPLISMTELNKNVLETNGFDATFTFGIPFEMGAPFIIESLCKDTEKPGLDKKPFHIVLSENKYSNGDIITTDFRNGRQIQICTTQEYGDEAKITPYGDGFKYMVVPASMSVEDFYPQEFLVAGTRYFKMYSDNGGEFQNVASGYSGILDKSAVQLFQYTVGDSQMAIESWFTSDSQLVSLSKSNELHPSIQHLSHDMGAKDAITNFFNIDPLTGAPVKGSATWMPTFIAKMIAELAEMKERKLLWSQGNARITNGREVVTSGLGYYQQIKQRGNHFYYSTFRQLFDYLQNFAAILFANNRNVSPDDRHIIWRMGTGASMELRKQWSTYFKTDNPFLVTLEHPALNEVLTKSNGGLFYKPPQFNKIFMPEVGTIEFKVDTQLDYIDSNLEQDKYTGRYPNSSYMVFIEDVTDKNFSNAILQGQTNSVGGKSYELGNTVMIKPKGYVEQINYIVGSGFLHPVLANFTGNKSGSSVVSTREKGFGVMAYTCGELWVQDPTRMIMLEYKPDAQ